MMGFSRPLPQPPGKPLLKNPSFSSSSSSSSTSSSATTTATSTTSATATGTATSSSPATNAEATVTKTKKVGGVQPFPSQWSVRRFFMGKRRWRKPVKKKTTGRVTSDTFLWLCYSSSSGKGKKIEICGKDLVVPVTVVVGGGGRCLRGLPQRSINLCQGTFIPSFLKEFWRRKRRRRVPKLNHG